MKPSLLRRFLMARLFNSVARMTLGTFNHYLATPWRAEWPLLMSASPTLVLLKLWLLISLGQCLTRLQGTCLRRGDSYLLEQYQRLPAVTSGKHG